MVGAVEEADIANSVGFFFIFIMCGGGGTYTVLLSIVFEYGGAVATVALIVLR